MADPPWMQTRELPSTSSSSRTPSAASGPTPGQDGDQPVTRNRLKVTHVTKLVGGHLQYYNYRQVLQTLCDSFRGFKPALHEFCREM